MPRNTLVVLDWNHEFRNDMYAMVLRNPKNWHVELCPGRLYIRELYGNTTYEFNRKHFDSVIFEASYAEVTRVV